MVPFLTLWDFLLCVASVQEDEPETVSDLLTLFLNHTGNLWEQAAARGWSHCWALSGHILGIPLPVS